MKYIPIKITIKRRENGENQHPPGHDGYEIDGFGIGMHYDECCDWDADGCRFAVTALPEERALNYIARAGGLVTPLTEAEAEAFFADHRKSEPAETFDVNTLQAIKLKKDLGIELTKEDQEALDPAHPRRGINLFKKGFKAKLPKNATL